MLCGALDPSFSLSSDFYYRSLLAKIYNKGKAKIKDFIAKEKPQFVSLALDGWSAHHHGYLGSIASTV